MKSYYYVAEVNLTHPVAPEVKGTNEDTRAVSFISRSFMDTESALQAVEKDIIDKLEKHLKAGNIPTRVSEVNPLRLTSMEALEQRAKDDASFAGYLSTWDNDLVTRMTIIDEDPTLPDDGQEVEEMSFADMPPTNYILRYYVREFEDGIEMPAEVSPFLSLSNAVH